MSSNGFRVNLSVPELGEALDKVGAYDGRTALKIENQVQTSTRNIAAGTRRRAVGSLKKKTSSRFDRKAVTGYVSVKSSIAHLVEFGAKAAFEKPDTKKALKIPSPGLGVADMYSKSAHIPQRKEHPYIRPSVEDEKPNLIKGLKEAVQP
jgi:hypothetical protein